MTRSGWTGRRSKRSASSGGACTPIASACSSVPARPSPGLAALEGLPSRRLGGLDPGAARALLATTVTGALNARVAARIITETGGNPLALMELAGQLTPDQLAGRSPLPQRLLVGRRMQGHFLGQVKMLPPATGSLLLLASAAPSDDPAALWRAAALLDLGPDAADPAVAQDIISLRPAGGVPAPADPLRGLRGGPVRLTGARSMTPGRASPDRTATPTRRPGTAPRPPSSRTRTSRPAWNAPPRGRNGAAATSRRPRSWPGRRS